MDITLAGIGKRFDRNWILADLNLSIKSADRLAVMGTNGSGKSTLLKLISGYLTASEGHITYTYTGNKIERDDIHRYLAFSAPYIELDEEFSIKELFEHYQVFKPFRRKNLKDFLAFTDFTKEANKSIKYFSSGMKQRLSLGFAFNMDVPLLLLDEPTSFLDDNYKIWYHNALKQLPPEQTIIIATNDKDDISMCNQKVTIQ